MSAHTSDPIYDMFVQYKAIAVVGLSAKLDRPSYRVAKFLKEQGYRIIPVTPTYDEVLGEKAYPNLLDVPKNQPIEIVDIFVVLNMCQRSLIKLSKSGQRLFGCN